MIVAGPHGVQIGSTGGVFAVKDFIFAQVENGGTADIAENLLCAWDLTSNIAVAGIMQDTWGLRVVVYPTAEANDVADGLNRKAGIVRSPGGMLGVPAGTRGRAELIQIYGAGIVKANTDGASNILAGGVIGPSGDEAGAVEGLQVEATLTDTMLSKAVGMSFEVVAINTTVNITAMIRLMG